MMRVKGRRIAGQTVREIATAEKINKNTVVRILSQDQTDELLRGYQSAIMEKMVPLALKGLEHLLKEKDRVAVVETLYGTKVLIQRQEVAVSAEVPQRDYADAKVEFYYKHGRWPTEKEARDFDQTITVEPLVKGQA